MKKTVFFVHIAVLAFALLSCTEKGEPSSGTGREMELTVSAAGQTKADDTPSEEDDMVKTLQVFVFSGNKLEAVSYSESDNVTLRCFEGSKNIYAIVNHAEIGWTPEMTDEKLLGTVLELKGPDDLNTMVGIETDMFLSMGADDSPVQLEIEVMRLAAKIVLNTVTNLSGKFLTIKRAYITNVAGDACLNAVSSDYSYAPQVWYNKMGLAENLGDLEDIFCSEERSVQVSLVHTFDGCFYCYPNPCEKDNPGLIELDKPLSRWTKLVLSAQYNGKSCYYVVPIGGRQEDYSFIRSNHSYEVDLVITGFGSWDEEGVDVTEGDEGNDDEDDGGEGGGDEGGGGDDEGGYKMPAPFPGIGDDKLSVKSRDRAAVINFAGGRAEVRKL